LKKLLIALSIFLAVAVGISVLFLWDGSTTDESRQSKPETTYKPRRTREEVDKGIAESRAARESLLKQYASESDSQEARMAREKRAALSESHTATGEKEARTRLEEIDKKLREASTEEEAEKLRRHRKLVEQVLDKLGQM